MPKFVYPFGARLEETRPSADEPREVFVLGAYPSALHAGWTPPSDANARSVKALAVADEPTPFWDGSDQDDLVDRWLEERDLDGHGRLQAAGHVNGSSGAWVRDKVLEPLQFDRADAWLTDCLTTYRSSRGQRRRITDTYEPYAAANGLPSATLPPHPDEDAIVNEALSDHRSRIRAEILRCRPDVAVSLGAAAARVLRTLADEVEDVEGVPEAQLSLQHYGQMWNVRFGDHLCQWLPLAHPAAPPRWQDAHDTWMQTVLGGHVGDVQRESKAPVWLPRKLLTNALELPDVLSKAAVRRLAAPAQRYAREVEGEAEIEELITRVIRASRQLSRGEGATAGVTMTAAEITTVFGSAGTLTLPAAVVTLAGDLTALAWIQSRMVLQIAAIHGHDMEDGESRRRELLHLWGLHSPTRQIGQGLSEGSQRVVKRLLLKYFKGEPLKAITKLFRIVGISFSRAGLVRALPFINIPVNAVVNDQSTKILGKRADVYFRTLPH